MSVSSQLSADLVALDQAYASNAADEVAVVAAQSALVTAQGVAVTGATTVLSSYEAVVADLVASYGPLPGVVASVKK